MSAFEDEEGQFEKTLPSGRVIVGEWWSAGDTVYVGIAGFPTHQAKIAGSAERMAKIVFEQMIKTAMVEGRLS